MDLEAGIIYLAGPISADPVKNHKKFEKATKKLRKKGYNIYSPVEFEKLHPGKSWNFYMSQCISEVPFKQFVVVLPGWEESKGANLEVAIARFLDIPVLKYPKLTKIKFNTKEWKEIIKNVHAKADSGNLE